MHYHTSTLILWLVTYCVNYTSTLRLVTYCVRLNAASCLGSLSGILNPPWEFFLVISENESPSSFILETQSLMRHLFIFNIHVCLESTFIPSCLLYYCRVFRWARAAGLRPHLCNPGASIQQVSTRSIYHKNFTSSLYYSLDFSTVGVHILFHGLVVYIIRLPLVQFTNY